MSIAEHVDTNREIAVLARAAGVPMRGYISNAVECPFEGTYLDDPISYYARRHCDEPPVQFDPCMLTCAMSIYAVNVFLLKALWILAA